MKRLRARMVCWPGVEWIVVGIVVGIAVWSAGVLVSCSTTNVDNSDDALRCLPVIYFAGSNTPILCNGDTGIIQVDAMSPDGDELEYIFFGDNGTITNSQTDPAVWYYSTNEKEGATNFHVYVKNECGYTSADFAIYNKSDCTDTDSQPIDPSQKKNVILMIGDGMGKYSEIAASRYLTGSDDMLFFHHLPYANSVTTWDVDTYNMFAYSLNEPRYHPDDFDPILGYDPSKGGFSQIREDETVDDYFLTPLYTWPTESGISVGRLPATDSGASATAMATGVKTDRHNVSWLSGDPANGEITTIAEYARMQKSMKVGVVTTVPFSHATPAAFVTHNVERNNYLNIAQDIVHNTQPDVVIGSGHPVYLDFFRWISRADYEYLQTAEEWEFVERESGEDGGERLLAGAINAVDNDTKLFGLFGQETFEYQMPVDDPGFPSVAPQTDENPTLAEATEAALTVLQESPAGFFLMVEAGDIDLGNHRYQYDRLIGNMYDFDKAIEFVVDWVNRDGDDVTWSNTLVIVTADHGNGYITFDEDNPLGPGDLPERDEELSTSYGDGQVDFQAMGHTNEMVSVYAMGGDMDGDGQGVFDAYEGLLYDDSPILDNTHIFFAMADFIGIDLD